MQKRHNVLAIADILKPQQIRLLAGMTRHRDEILDSSVYLEQNYPWVLNVYREAVDAISSAGFMTVIENEAHKCFFANPTEIISFFDKLDLK